MSVVPIYSAIELARFMIVPALDALTARPVAWWHAQQGAALPYVTVHSQDLGGVSVPRLNSLGWSGLITVKAYAGDLPAAEALLALIAPGIDALVAPVGYDLSVEYRRPVSQGPTDGVHACGHIWEVRLERE